MTGFRQRSEKADSLQKPFVAEFNRRCRTHSIAVFGVEHTDIARLHKHLTTTRDPTADFLRYLPDAALIRAAGQQTPTQGPVAALLEFKVHDTPVRTPGFFRRIQQEHERRNGGHPPLTEFHDILGIERDSLDAHRRLKDIDVITVVVGWQAYRHPPQMSVRAQFADQIIVCSEHTPSRGGTGSGTVMANVHAGSMPPAIEFFAAEFNIGYDVMQPVIEAIARPRTPPSIGFEL